MASDQLRSPEVFPQKPGFPRILARDLAGENLRAVLDGGPGGSEISSAHQCGRCYRKDISLIEYPTKKKTLLPHSCGPLA